MATIMERKGKKGTTYTAVIRMKGYDTVSETFDRKSDAKRWVEETQTAMRQGRHFKTAESKKRTVEDLIDKYTDDILPTRKRDKQTVEGQLLWWRSQMGKFILADVTPQLIGDYRDKLMKELNKNKKLRGNATIVRYLATLSVCFSYAVKDLGWLEDNPVLKVRKPSLPRGRVKNLTPEERHSLLAHCKLSINKYLYPVVVIALSTGARQNEIMYLKWSDIDFHRKLMHLEETKNGERRTVPLSKMAFQEICKLKEVRRIDTQYIFPRKDGQKPMDIRKHWEKAVQESGLEDFHFHDLRHAAASQFAISGASTLEIAHILGHKTLAMVKRYAHLTEQRTSEILEKANEQQFQKTMGQKKV